MELKLGRYCKKLRFLVVIKTLDNQIFQGQTVEFGSHNNGKAAKAQETASTISTGIDTLPNDGFYNILNYVMNHRESRQEKKIRNWRRTYYSDTGQFRSPRPC